MQIRNVSAKEIFDAQKKETILVTITTTVGTFSGSSPSEESKGKFTLKPYKKSLSQDIETLAQFEDYFLEEWIEQFDDLRRIEDIVAGHIGAHTLFAFETAILKALAYEKKCPIWKLINSHQKKIPKLLGVILTGKNSAEKKPDFSAFLVQSKKNLLEEVQQEYTLSRMKLGDLLTKYDMHFSPRKDLHETLTSSLPDKEVLEVIQKLNMHVGIGVSATQFYRRGAYHYKNPILKRTPDEHAMYLSNLIKTFGVFYIEDPFQEDDFESFAKLLKKFPDRMIVGGDLIAMNAKRLSKAIQEKSISGINITPHHSGSLIALKAICELADANNIKKIFAVHNHASEESILVDLAFGFGVDFLQSEITGEQKDTPIERLKIIEKEL